MEVLNQFLNIEAMKNKSGIGIKLRPRTPAVPCLMFADDCLLFCKTKASSCSMIKNTLDKFCNLSGQLVNFHKSAVTFSKNVTSAQKQATMSILNIPHKDSLGKYLGCPVFQGKPSKTTFQEIISKATFKLAGWKANSLSKAGRSILIQSHLESLPAHTMQYFQLPQSTSNHINKISRDFFW